MQTEQEAFCLGIVLSFDSSFIIPPTYPGSLIIQSNRDFIEIITEFNKYTTEDLDYLRNLLFQKHNIDPLTVESLAILEGDGAFYEP